MSAITLLISISVLALIILYFQYKNNKNMENLKLMVSTIQPPVMSTTLVDKNDFIEQNNLINKKLDALYTMTTDRYEKLHQAIDSIPVIGMTEEYSAHEQKDYQGLAFIDMEQPNNIELSNNSQNSIKKKTDTKEVKNESIKSKTNSNRSLNIELNLHKDNVSNEFSKNTDAKYPKLNELRDLCKERNLSPYGNKKTLIHLLIENGYKFF